jgi:hypothetical protein
MCKLSFIPSFPSSAATYILSAHTCTTTIVSLEPCALNAEFCFSKRSIFPVIPGGYLAGITLGKDGTCRLYPTPTTLI